MIPKLTPSHTLEPLYLAFLSKLEQSHFSGDIEQSYASRLSVATDNSVYQLLPQAVVFPKGIEDIQALTKLASTDTFQAIKLCARGGGTGTNGQALTQGIVVDLSRYMNALIELNVEERWVRVQSGIVKDQLNALLKPHGLFFSPELSTSNRATIGGMIATDASGQGSLVYGKTSDHVKSLAAVLANGELLHTQALSLTSLASMEGTLKPIYDVVKQVCVDKRAEIEAKFPQLNRFLTGYDLKHTFNIETQHVDLTRLLCGAEGSLAIVAEAKLNLTRIPQHRTLVTLKYDSFDSALRHAPVLVQAQALSVETIDSKVLALAREDASWHSVDHLIRDVEGAHMAGINIVEFASDNAQEIATKLTYLCTQLDSDEAIKAGVIGYQVCDELDEINAIYAMRKKAVGLLGNTKGWAKPVAFTEDTCVPPEHLADYIREFRALLDEQGLHYGMFGHVDSGVLHVRPALDLCDPEQERLMREISDKVVALTAKYGGLMWGEHGKGFRSEYGPEFFGESLFSELRRIKSAFDPHNQLNPGKICTPLASDEALVSVDADKRGRFDRQIPIAVRNSFKESVECNGNGLCFNFDEHTPMCPSFKVSGDRRFSPKGRAGLMREWLRQLEKLKRDPIECEANIGKAIWHPEKWLQRAKNSWAKYRGEYDYSHEVYEAMASCLACKACSTACPIKVDVPNFRARFFNLYHSRYLRPVKDYLVAYVEFYGPLMARFPRLSNALLSPKWLNQLISRVVGMVDLPKVSYPSLAKRVPESLCDRYSYKRLKRLSSKEKARTVLLVQDPFTSCYEAELVEDAVKLIKAIGLNPVLLPFMPNGKAEHIKGFLDKFARTARNTASFLNQVAELNIPMIGLEPATVLCYRDEYKQCLGESRGDFMVHLFQEWLVDADFGDRSQTQGKDWYLFGHCTEKALVGQGVKQWQQVFARFGQTLHEVSVGCCGMAGTYGHDAKQVTDSKRIYSLSWEQKLATLDRARCLATGYSCRSQVKRMSEHQLKHPLQALLESLHG